MDTAQPPAKPGLPDPQRYAEVQVGAEFSELRRSYRDFAFPLTVGFIAWYLLYVLLSTYAGDFMGAKVLGNINVAFVLGLLQFATTFAIAWLYARHANTRLDPRADSIRAGLENTDHKRHGADAAHATDRTEGDA